MRATRAQAGSQLHASQRPLQARRITRRAVWAALITAAALGAGVPTAQAAFPGLNGHVAFDRTTHDATANATTDQIGSYDGLSATVLAGPGTSATSPAWSADGTKLAFVEPMNSGTERHIFVSDASGANPQDVSAASGAPGPIVDTAPAWSPGGRLVFVAGNTSNNGGDITIMNVDGASRHGLAWASGGDNSPAWSPDGTSIAFDRAVSSGWANILVGNADGTGTPVNISAYNNDHSPNWSPDGTSLAFQRSAGPSSQIVTQSPTDTTGATTVVLAGSGAADRSPAYSPDGSRIAFTEGAFQQTSIWVMAADGSGAAQVFPPASAPAGSGSYAQDIKPDWQVSGPAPTAKPVATAGPTLSNPPIVPNTLQTSDGAWTNCETAHPCTFDVQWMRCAGACAGVGADSHGYGLTDADVGSTIAACVTASNSAGSANAPACSTAVGPITSASAASGTTTAPTTVTGTTTIPTPGTPGTAPAPLFTPYTPPHHYTVLDAPGGLFPAPSTSMELYIGGKVFGSFGMNDGTQFVQGDQIQASNLCGYPVAAGDVYCSTDITDPNGAEAGTIYTQPERGTLPTDLLGTYDVDLVSTLIPRAAGQATFHDDYGSYQVVAPSPSPRQQINFSLGQLAGSLRSDLSSATLPGGQELRYKGQPIAEILSDGKVIAADQGQIIAAGSGNVIAAGSGNVIAAGSHNLIVMNRAGQAVAIIAAGSGNLTIIATDKVGLRTREGNIPAFSFDTRAASPQIATGSYRVIAAGSGNVIAAGSGNIIAAGSYNIIAAGSYNIIAAGSGNLGDLALRNGATFSHLDPGTIATSMQHALAGAGNLQLGFTLGGVGVQASSAARTTLASGSARFIASGQMQPVVLRMGTQARRLFKRLAMANVARKRHHTALRRLRLVETIGYAPRIGKRLSYTRTITITPGSQSVALKHQQRHSS